MIEGKVIASAHVLLGERDSGGFGPNEFFMNFTDGTQFHIKIEDGVLKTQLV